MQRLLWWVFPADWTPHLSLIHILVNGSSGIAVGMATNIPPHNLREVINAAICVLDNPEAELSDLMEHIKGPDFPTPVSYTHLDVYKRQVFDEDRVLLSAKTGNGEAKDVCRVSGSGGGLEIGFNNRYLMEALKYAPADTVRLELNTGVSPCVIVPTEGEENFLYMVLPVRLKASRCV